VSAPRVSAALLSCAVLSCAVVCLATACASTSTPQSRELPTGLSALSDLLVGCERSADADGAQHLACAGDVEVDVRPAPDRTLAQFRDHVNARATALGAQVVWDETAVATEAQDGLVTRAQALLPLSETPTVTWLGVVRTLDDGGAEQLACSSTDERGAARCEGIVGALMSAHASGGLPAPRSARSPASAFGRALSMPTACDVSEVSKKSGAARCDDGVQLTWAVHASMEDAVQALQAQLDATGESADGAPFACTILGEVGQCEQRARAIAGATYVDGEAVAVVCLGATDLKKHGACRALILSK
jgi:hypothetical protein